MKCPYCGNEMISGRIPEDRFTLKWFPEEAKEGIKKAMPLPLKKGMRLNPKRTYIITYYCQDCKKFIIDQDENEAYVETKDSIWYF